MSRDPSFVIYTYEHHGSEGVLRRWGVEYKRGSETADDGMNAYGINLDECFKQLIKKAEEDKAYLIHFLKELRIAAKEREVCEHGRTVGLCSTCDTETP